MSSGRGLGWMARRLAAMTPAEVGHHVRRVARERSMASRGRWVAPAPTGVPESPDPWPLGSEPDPQVLADLRVGWSEDLLGRETLLGVEVEDPRPRWRADLRTGLESPLTFGPGMTSGDEAFGDVRGIWERSRHGRCTRLAVAWRLGQGDEYAAACGQGLADWIEQDPFPLGVNWASPLEAGMRLIAWVWIERLLRGSKEHADLFGPRGLAWDQVYWHQWWLARSASAGSSANNHVIGEMAGLLLAAEAWPFFAESERWARKARARLEREAAAQAWPSGLTREQAFGYHLYVLELLMLAGMEARRVGRPMSDGYEGVVRRMAHALSDLVAGGGLLPTYGDSDDAVGLALFEGSHRTAKELALARSAFGADVPAVLDGAGATMVDVMCGGSAEAPAGDHRRPARFASDTQGSRRMDYPDAGLYAFGSSLCAEGEVFGLMDAGPHGYLSIAAHAHADALSLTLDVAGQPVIVDPGTYAYGADPEWRYYFRGTSAHATVLVDGQDQSLSGGLFMWTRHANTTVVEHSRGTDSLRLVAEHDGYARLADPVIHRRTLDQDGCHLAIIDELRGEGTHTADWRATFHPDVRAHLRDDACELTWGDEGRARLRLDPKMRWRVERGAAGAGWYSPRFGVKVPTATLIGTWVGEMPVRFELRLEVGS